MGLFDLFKKKETKTVKAPIECRIGDLLEIERRLEAEKVWVGSLFVILCQHIFEIFYWYMKFCIL